MKLKLQDVIIALGVLGIVMVIILPIPTVLMDVLLVVNIAASLLILLMSIYITEPLQFASFPTVLLLLTLYRL